MKTGDVILYYKHGIIGNLIGFFTQSKISHAGMVVLLDGIPFVIEANGFKNDVVIQDFQSSVRKNKIIILELKGVLKHEKEFKSDLQILSNIEYDYKTLAQHIYKKKFAEDNEKVVCSELAAMILDIYHNADINSSRIVPGDFLRNPKLRSLFA